MERLLPDPGPTTPAEQLERFSPAERAHADRPYVFSNFAETVDGRASISGRSGSIGSDRDTEMLMGLRAHADAVLVGAGTIRAEEYGRLMPGGESRALRERRGLAPDPSAVVVTRHLDLPWDAGLFTSGCGEVLIFTTSAEDPPETATPVRVERRDDELDLAEILTVLREREGVRALLCEGGPSLHGELIDRGLIDELFVTLGSKLGGGDGPHICEGLDGGARELELLWLLRNGSELFARYGLRPA